MALWMIAVKTLKSQSMKVMIYLLIDLVGECPWLYDKAAKGYSDQIMNYMLGKTSVL